MFCSGRCQWLVGGRAHFPPPWQIHFCIVQRCVYCAISLKLSYVTPETRRGFRVPHPRVLNARGDT